jgi:uncharacterized integral membrane protein (TIGR00698 family)
VAGCGAAVPGLALVGGLVAVSLLVARAAPWVSPLTVAVVLGVLVANTVGVPARAGPGLRIAGRLLLRIGVALLGLQLVPADVADLGAAPVLALCGGVVLVFTCSLALGRRLGLAPGRAALVAVGVAVCGAAAVAAMSSVTDSDEEDAATAVAVVTLYGSAAVLLLPLAAAALALPPAATGAWAGAGVHEVAQVVATAAPAGEVALLTAVVVKLVRVLMLVPLVLFVAVLHRRASGTRATPGTLVPWFLTAFVVAVAVRSTGLLPAVVLDAGRTASVLLLAAALVSLGTGVHLGRLLRSGGPALLVGALASGLALAVGLVPAVLLRA